MIQSHQCYRYTISEWDGSRSDKTPQLSLVKSEGRATDFHHYLLQSFTEINRLPVPPPGLEPRINRSKRFVISISLRRQRAEEGDRTLDYCLQDSRYVQLNYSGK